MGSPENRVASDSVDTTSKNDSDDDDENGVDSPPSEPCPFSEGEKVLAYHNSIIYEAKVQPLAPVIFYPFLFHFSDS